METERPSYQAYLLRLWQVSGDKTPTWRILLEDAHTGERVGFASLEALLAFLQKRGQTLLPEIVAPDD